MGSERLEEGTLLSGRYEIQEIVGRGGMGTVYRARDRHLDIVVAVKEMNDRHATSEEREAAIRQFEREARILAQLSHPNLPRVTDYFVDGRRCYLIMEFIVGETLDARLRNATRLDVPEVMGPRGHSSPGERAHLPASARSAPLPLLEVLDWAVQLADVLAYLHAQTPPIIFRDVKPANIMLTEDGTLKLIDFGIARRFQEGATKDTLLYGSPGYSPPEQYGRAQTDPRSDLYAFGATLHHLVTGRDPSPTPFKFPPITSFDPTLPPSLENLIARCVEIDKERRFQSAEEARDILIHIRAAVAAASRAEGGMPRRGEGEDRFPASRPPTSATQHPRNRRIVVVISLFLALLLSGASLFVLRQRGERVPAPGARTGSETAPPPTGELRIESAPMGAAIFLNGQGVGTTPRTVEKIPPGRHVIRLIPPPESGLAEAQREIEIRPGETRILDVQLGPKALPNAGESVPSALVQSVDVQMMHPPQSVEPGLRFSVAFRVANAVGKNGQVGIAFYEADQTTPLAPRTPDSPYRSAEGQLMVTEAFKIEADPAEFAVFEIFVPETAFPTSYGQITYRAIIYVDGRAVGQSAAHPLMAGGAG